MLSDNKQPAIFYVTPYYCVVQDSIFYVLNDFKITEKYNFKKDSLQKNKLSVIEHDKEIINFSKAYIQNYTNDVIENKMTYTLKTKK
jgi:hypothetical protein